MPLNLNMPPTASSVSSPRVSDLEAGRDHHFPQEKENSRQLSDTPSTAFLDPTTGRDTRFLVGWAGEDDIEHPHNWNRAYRWFLTFLGGLLCLNASFSSSAPAGIVPDMMHRFGFGREVGALTVALFVAGYCIGPLLWGPLSETYGRKPIFIVSFIFYTIFQIACAVADNTASILIFRLLGGCFAASPLTNAGALMGDMWDAKTRGKAMALFTVAPFAGPALGPTVSGFMAVTNTNWRWLFWVLAIFAGVCLGLIIFTLPETYSPVILKRKAQRKRKETGDDRWYAPIEANRIPAGQRLRNILAKPWSVLFAEPMLIAITVYTSFIYGCLYACFESFPIVFQIGHGLSAGVSGLTFLPIFIGGALGCFVTVFYYNPQYEKLVEEYAPKPVPPEKRLPMGCLGGCIFAVSFFWFGWTSYPSVSIWSPLFAAGALGLSITLIFLSLFNYMIDSYLQVAASALAANTVVRSAFGAAFPLFSTQMYEALNPRWASTLFGCLALLLAPIPFLFIKYGPVLRANSKYAPVR